MVDRDATVDGVALPALLIGGAPAPAPIPHPAPEPPAQPGGWVPYQIPWGDTLSDIAARTGTTVAELCRVNGIGDPNRIQAGAVILVPGNGGSGGAMYRIQWGTPFPCWLRSGAPPWRPSPHSAASPTSTRSRPVPGSAAPDTASARR